MGIMAARRAVKLFAVVLLFALLLEATLHFIGVLVNRDKLLIFRDYGIDVDAMQKIFIKKYECGLFRIICFGIFIIMCIYHANEERIVSTYTLLFPVLSLFSMIIINRINKSIMKQGIKKVYSWRYRC